MDTGWVVRVLVAWRCGTGTSTSGRLLAPFVLCAARTAAIRLELDPRKRDAGGGDTRVRETPAVEADAGRRKPCSSLSLMFSFSSCKLYGGGSTSGVRRLLDAPSESCRSRGSSGVVRRGIRCAFVLSGFERDDAVGAVYDGAVFTGPDDERLNPRVLGFSADETVVDDVVPPPFRMGNALSERVRGCLVSGDAWKSGEGGFGRVGSGSRPDSWGVGGDE